MRTTVTLDDDVASLVEKRRRETGKGFKEVLNEALRDALTRPMASKRRTGRPPMKTFSVGKVHLDLDDVSAVLGLTPCSCAGFAPFSGSQVAGPARVS